MRIRTAARLGGIALAVLGLLGALVPSASAAGTKTITFTGTATFDPGTGGLDLPCRVGTTKPCPPTVTPGTPNKKGHLFQVSGNTRTGGFNSVTCVGTWESTKKTPPAGVDPACSIGARFTVTGHCGLSYGTGTGTARVGTQPITFNFTWTDPGGGNLVIRGWWTSPTTPRGDINAAIKATPPPILAGNPPITNINSCLDKTARIFEIEGTATLTNPKTPAP